uniref:non-specific serine/threonine protein kinase n=1 Tax=Oreochromis niloticus TaxID=8128 RepID=A0A669BL83_ORENI
MTGKWTTSVGKSATVSILDWHELEKKVLLIMTVPCVKEEVLKLNGVFHRDIRTENVLVETGPHDYQVRVIDFGCGCLAQEEPYSILWYDIPSLLLTLCLFIAEAKAPPPKSLTHGRYEAPPQSGSWACCYMTCWMESNNLPHLSISARRPLLILRCPKVRKCHKKRPVTGTEPKHSTQSRGREQVLTEFY